MVTGTIDRWKTNDLRDSIGVLLINTHIKGISSEFRCAEDHLWLWVDSGEDIRLSRYKRLSVVSYAGEIQNYRRADKTIDCSVKYRPDLIPWSIFYSEKMPELLRTGQWQLVLDTIDSGLLFDNSISGDRERFLADLASIRSRVILNIESISRGSRPPPSRPPRIGGQKLSKKKGFG
jgi:hypothetical protein